MLPSLAHLTVVCPTGSGAGPSRGRGRRGRGRNAFQPQPSEEEEEEEEDDPDAGITVHDLFGSDEDEADDVAPRPTPASQTAVLGNRDMLATILNMLGSGNVEQACRSVWNWCNLNSEHQTACNDQRTWETITRRLFADDDIVQHRKSNPSDTWMQIFRAMCRLYQQREEYARAKRARQWNRRRENVMARNYVAAVGWMDFNREDENEYRNSSDYNKHKRRYETGGELKVSKLMRDAKELMHNAVLSQRNVSNAMRRVFHALKSIREERLAGLDTEGPALPYRDVPSVRALKQYMQELRMAMEADVDVPPNDEEDYDSSDVDNVMDGDRGGSDDDDD